MSSREDREVVHGDTHTKEYPRLCRDILAIEPYSGSDENKSEHQPDERLPYWPYESKYEPEKK